MTSAIIQGVIYWNDFGLQFKILHMKKKSSFGSPHWKTFCSSKKPSFFLLYVFSADRFNGDVEIKNVTEKGGILSWSEAGTNVSLYRVEISGNLTENVTNETSYQTEGLLPGTLYKVQVIPVKCDRDLNAQYLSFYTCE